MTSLPVSRAPRLEPFTENELHLMRGSLLSFASDLLEDAASGEIADADLEYAGATYAQAMVLAHEVDDQLSIEHPPVEDALTLAGVIAEGDAPLVCKMAAEAEGAQPLGAHADVPVTPEEDEAHAQRSWDDISPLEPGT